ncbi:MAG: DUF4860 domain-containing protein [Lachnospiraceae bacterium]|nr:DUF4860 domain-containing protein [Lachnospiraceae bacterium]
MKKVRGEHNIDSVFVLLLFVVFAGSVLLVLLFGASSYESLVKRDTKAYNDRTAISYVAAKIRHSDEKNSVYVGSFTKREDPSADGISTLYLKLIAEGETYYTKIYYYDGYIREVLCEENAGLLPQDGNEIMKAKGLSFTEKDQLLQIKVLNEDGSESALKLALRSEQEVK